MLYKIMALDIGTKRIGIALSDYLLMLANGHSYISRDNKSVEQILKIAKENKGKKILINLSGRGDKDIDFVLENYPRKF